ncbi:hypothetical protein ACH4M4_02950 [Streptomyces sp. NPDC017254]
MAQTRAAYPSAVKAGSRETGTVTWVTEAKSAGERKAEVIK